jgi:hypothetical protein
VLIFFLFLKPSKIEISGSAKFLSALNEVRRICIAASSLEAIQTATEAGRAIG